MITSRRQVTLTEIGRLRASAIIRTNAMETAAAAMEAAVAGGFRMVEFTLTTPGALELIRQFAARPDILVGAGTVLTVEEARAAVKAGARFLVSPITDAAIIKEAAALDVVCIPGTFTPTEMTTADRLGADIVKLFPAPAEVAEYVAAILAPLPHLKIFPTAGVTADNFRAILRAGAFGVGFVKSLFDPALLAKRDYAAIERKAREIHSLVRDVG
jgi:2-dehydro-3-deoxyphosphogluconate aldolase / (4S)-4-hydroxy-2-oxoglutarate aldolase